MSMIARVAAAEAVMARFNGAPLAWGETDCVRLAVASLRALGHRVSLAKGGRYGSALGARRALKRAGFDRLEPQRHDVARHGLHGQHLGADVLDGDPAEEFVLVEVEQLNGAVAERM